MWLMVVMLAGLFYIQTDNIGQAESKEVTQARFFSRESEMSVPVMCVCVCVCVRERERERERVCVCVAPLSRNHLCITFMILQRIVIHRCLTRHILVLHDSFSFNEA